MSSIARGLLAIAILGSPAAAIAQTVTGTITGIVRDTSAAVLPGVTVTFIQVETGRRESVVTDRDGRYTSQPLQLGNYRVEAALSGFKSSARGPIPLTIDDVARLDFTLEVGTLQRSSKSVPRRRWSTRGRLPWASWWTTAASPSCRSTRATCTR